MSYQSVILADSPVAYWPLNETSGTTAYDLSGNGNNGTYNGGIVLADYPAPLGAGGSAPKFDGSTAYVTGSQLLTAATANVSLEAWVNFEGISSPNGGCFLKNGQYNNGYAIGNGGTSFDTAGNNLIGLYEITSWNPTTSAIPTSNWHHCVIVIGANSTSTFYIDGVQVATNSNSDINTPGAQWVIGADDNNGSGVNTTGRFFAGSLSNVAIYPTALDATQIQTHYTAGVSNNANLTGVLPNLMASFYFKSAQMPASLTATFPQPVAAMNLEAQMPASLTATVPQPVAAVSLGSQMPVSLTATVPQPVAVVSLEAQMPASLTATFPQPVAAMSLSVYAKAHTGSVNPDYLIVVPPRDTKFFITSSVRYNSTTVETPIRSVQAEP